MNNSFRGAKGDFGRDPAMNISFRGAKGDFSFRSSLARAPHGAGEDGRTVNERVARLSEDQPASISLVLERGSHVLVCNDDVTSDQVEVFRSRPQEHPDRLVFGPADQSGVGIRTPKVDEAAATADNLAEGVGLHPGDGNGIIIRAVAVESSNFLLDGNRRVGHDFRFRALR
jgi:hypothetical protein